MAASKKAKHMKSKSKAGAIKASVRFGQHSNKKMVIITIRIPRKRLTNRLNALQE